MSQNLKDHNENIRAHFSPLAADYLRLKNKNRYYNQYLKDWCRSLLPPGRSVVDFGCGRGDVLDYVRPRRGLGLDICGSLVESAAAEYPQHQFVETAIENFKPDEEYDAVLLINTLEYIYDIGTVLENAREALRDNGRIFLSTANPLWSPIFKFASKIGLRIPECERLFVTNEDVVNMLKLHGFQVVYKKMGLPIPKRIPILGDFLNFVVPRIPIIRLLSSTQLIVARKVPQKRREYSVSVIVPCYNEVDNIERCIRETVPLGTSTEVIFVDDGSRDGTAEKVREVSAALLREDIDIRLISYRPNGGKGHAVKTGFDNARGEILMVLDADLTTHPDELRPLYEAFATGRAEFINCTRMIYPMEDASMKITNYVGNKFFTILVSLIMESRVSDTLCGTKAMFRWDYEHFTMGRDPWSDYDVLFGAAEQRLVIQELPVHYRARVAGDSKMQSYKHAMNLLRMCWYGFWQIKTLREIPVRSPVAKIGDEPVLPQLS